MQPKIEKVMYQGIPATKYKAESLEEAITLNPIFELFNPKDNPIKTEQYDNYISETREININGRDLPIVSNYHRYKNKTDEKYNCVYLKYMINEKGMRYDLRFKVHSEKRKKAFYLFCEGHYFNPDMHLMIPAIEESKFDFSHRNRDLFPYMMLALNSLFIKEYKSLGEVIFKEKSGKKEYFEFYFGCYCEEKFGIRLPNSKESPSPEFSPLRAHDPSYVGSNVELFTYHPTLEKLDKLNNWYGQFFKFLDSRKGKREKFMQNLRRLAENADAYDNLYGIRDVELYTPIVLNGILPKKDIRKVIKEVIEKLPELNKAHKEKTDKSLFRKLKAGMPKELFELERIINEDIL